MDEKLTKLQAKLRELFQLNEPDLDFGLYRVMHAKRAEVERFLTKGLPETVGRAFGKYQSADKAGIQAEIDKARQAALAAGFDPEQSPKVKELRTQLATTAVDLEGLRGDVYSHLLTFFSRYYSDGDFLSKQVYKDGVYAIPYRGEEVLLHWANKDQYYIKTSEHLRHYAFRVGTGDLRVVFKLVDAAEGEHANVKESAEGGRVFILAEGEFAKVAGKDLELAFRYRPATMNDWPAEERANAKKPPKQEDLRNWAVQRVLAANTAKFGPWLTELAKLAPTEKQPKRTVLGKYLESWTKTNTFDYFIHKDLGGFLRRELDFYIKNEVMHLDDIESETQARVEQYLSKIRVMREVAGAVIGFLSQLEEFQKRLWLKKKFVVETSWCVRVGLVPERMLAEVAGNEAQRQEWVELLGIDQIKGDLATVGYSVPLSVQFLKGQPGLMVDTRHFSAEFTGRLLEKLGDVEEQVDGTLFHSENFQALSLMQRRYRGSVGVTYIDPPYNTPYSEILYKNNYLHSSWLSLIANSLPLARTLWAPNFAFGIAIDDYELVRLAALLDGSFPELSRTTVVVNHHPQGAGGRISRTHEYYLLISPEDAPPYQGEVLDDADEDRSFMRAGTGENNFRYGRWRSFYALLRDPISGKITGAEAPVPLGQPYPVGLTSSGLERIYPINSRGEERVWRSSYETGRRRAEDGELTVSSRGAVYQAIAHSGKRSTLFSNWVGPEYNAGTHGSTLLSDLGLGGRFDYPKSIRTMETCLWAQSYGARDFLVLDYFGGSGTTCEAAIRMNRRDGGGRRFVTVEMGSHFDTVLLPRLKKVTYTPEWKDGRPKRPATPDETSRAPRILKVLRLESYEDTLNNLEFSARPQAIDDLFASNPDLHQQYLLKYLIPRETAASASLLNFDSFADPTAYRLKVKRPGGEESRETTVDLVETFNWLLGLSVHLYGAPTTFSATFAANEHDRIAVSGRLRADPSGPYWLRAIEGTSPKGERVLVIWRKLTGDLVRDNAVLDAWFDTTKRSSRDSEFAQIYVNGDNNLENMKRDDETWKVLRTEHSFYSLMFADAEAAAHDVRVGPNDRVGV